MKWHKFRALGSWLRELRMLALAVFYVLLGFALIYGFGVTEQAIRLTGLFLQVLGIGTVVWGITKTRAHFGHPPILHGVGAWFRRCPILPRKVYGEVDAVTASLSLVGARLTTVFTAKPDLRTEERISHIESGLNIIQTRIESAEKHMDREFSSAHNKLAAEARAREDADTDVLHQLESSSTGGISISAIGTLWLFIGVILSSASPELALWWR